MSEVITKNTPTPTPSLALKSNSPSQFVNNSNSNNSNINKENDIILDLCNGHTHINNNISLSYSQTHELNHLNAALKKDKDKDKSKMDGMDYLINSNTITINRQDKTSFINADFLDRSELRQITNKSKNMTNNGNKNNSQTFDINFINSFNNSNFNLLPGTEDPNLIPIPKSGKFNSLKLAETVNSHVE